MSLDINIELNESDLEHFKSLMKEAITKAKDLSLFFVGIEKFPFYTDVIESLKTYYPNYEELSDNDQKYLFVKAMLEEDKLNLSFYPKGLLPFHKYKDHNASAFEEHSHTRQV